MNPAARRTHVLHWIDVGTTVAFALEALLKIVAFGFRPYIAFNSNKARQRVGRWLLTHGGGVRSKYGSIAAGAGQQNRLTWRL